MSEFTLPANSKVTAGKHWPASQSGGHIKSFRIYRWDPAREGNPALDEFEIDRQVVALNGPPIESIVADPARAAALARLANDGIAELVAKHPKRFTAVGSVDVAQADAPERIGEWVKRGVSGLRLFTGGSTQAFDPSSLDDEKPTISSRRPCGFAVHVTPGSAAPKIR